jgi:hypothetical protein
VRESIKDLINSGELKNGSELIWNRSREGVKHIAVIESGLIKTADGQFHRTPSGAARHLNGDKPIDGWKCWRLKTNYLLIDELRHRE